MSVQYDELIGIHWMQQVEEDGMNTIQAEPRLTGGSSGYYKADIDEPTSGGAPYVAECNDIIEALKMDFAEGNAFKAIWRIASARLGNGKPGTTALYDAEKVEFFGKRMVVRERKRAQQKANAC